MFDAISQGYTSETKCLHASNASSQDALLDDVMLGFRLKEGLDLQVVADNYGHAAVRRVEKGVAEGLQRGWVIRERANDSSTSSTGAGVVAGGVVAGGVVIGGGEDGGEDGGGTGGGQEFRSRGDAVGDCGIGSDAVGEATTFGDRKRGRSSGSVEDVYVDTDEGAGVSRGEGSTASAAAGAAAATRAESPGGGVGRLRLSDPDGFLFSNSVISSVFCELDGWDRSKSE